MGFAKGRSGSKGLREFLGVAQQPGTTAVHVRIYGRVQGVFFRAWTEDEATARGLSGWVRNRSDGTVEAVFSGPEAKVDEMVAACRRGPPLAEVTRIEQSPAGEAALSLWPGPGFGAIPSV
jgi:acylphosphatase